LLVNFSLILKNSFGLSSLLRCVNKYFASQNSSGFRIVDEEGNEFLLDLDILYLHNIFRKVEGSGTREDIIKPTAGPMKKLLINFVS